MTKLQWDVTGERKYETGSKQGVLYPQDSNGTYPLGVAWNGLTNVNINPTGADATALWADDMKYLNLIAREELEGSIEAYTYPDEFAECNGEVALTTGVMLGQQTRKTFGFCFRTVLGNDVLKEDYGYKLHIIYGATAAPSQKSYETINDSPNAITFSWDFKTVPVNVTGHKPTAYLEIDSTKVDSTKLKDLEDVLYGTDADAENNIEATTARLPLPDEVYYIITGQNIGD